MNHTNEPFKWFQLWAGGFRGSEAARSESHLRMSAVLSKPAEEADLWPVARAIRYPPFSLLFAGGSSSGHKKYYHLPLRENKRIVIYGTTRNPDRRQQMVLIKWPPTFGPLGVRRKEYVSLKLGVWE